MREKKKSGKKKNLIAIVIKYGPSLKNVTFSDGMRGREH